MTADTTPAPSEEISRWVADSLRRLVTSIHPGQTVYPRTLRTLFARQRRRGTSEDIRTLKRILTDDRAVATALLDHAVAGDLVFIGDDGVIYRRLISREEAKRAILDINNLVWSLNSQTPRIAAVASVVERLRALGVDEIVGVADANIVHTVVDAEEIDAVAASLDRYEVVERGETADRRVIEIAQEGHGFVVSNDRFRDWRRHDGWVRSDLWRLRVPCVIGRSGELELGMVGLQLQADAAGDAAKASQRETIEAESER